MAKHKNVKFSAEEMAYEMPAELDFSKLRHIPGGLAGLRRYMKAKRADRNVKLDPDVFLAFPTAEEVNDVLRIVMKVRELGKRKRRRVATIVKPKVSKARRSARAA